jgi:hypothetical protein
MKNKILQLGNTLVSYMRLAYVAFGLDNKSESNWSKYSYLLAPLIVLITIPFTSTSYSGFFRIYDNVIIAILLFLCWASGRVIKGLSAQLDQSKNEIDDCLSLLERQHELMFKIPAPYNKGDSN